jgi:hypothetical protein
MTDNNHPITPPPELVQQWALMIEQHTDTEVFTIAARWGSDQELEACCEWLRHDLDAYELFGLRAVYLDHNLRAARRPKPPSLREQALAELELLRGDANAHGLGFDAPAIRRALEALPND